MRADNNDYIGWINQRAMRGRTFFTKDDLLMKKLPDVLDEKQKLNKIGNLRTQLRVAGKIRVGERKRWRLM